VTGGGGVVAGAGAGAFTGGFVVRFGGVPRDDERPFRAGGLVVDV